MSIPMDHEIDDLWAVWSSSSSRFQAAPSRSALRIETIGGAAPLNTQIGAFPKKTVPAAFYDSLFGQWETTETEIETGADDRPVMRTYAILDGAKIADLPEMLEGSGLEHRCLFKGNAYDELKNAAPWTEALASRRR